MKLALPSTYAWLLMCGPPGLGVPWAHRLPTALAAAHSALLAASASRSASFHHHPMPLASTPSPPRPLLAAARFYGLFHLWLNILGELTCFGDREFYKARAALLVRAGSHHAVQHLAARPSRPSRSPPEPHVFSPAPPAGLVERRHSGRLLEAVEHAGWGLRPCICARSLSAATSRPPPATLTCPRRAPLTAPAVHKWLLRHVYFPAVRLGASRFSAILLTFFVSAGKRPSMDARPVRKSFNAAHRSSPSQVSAVFHELLLGVPLHMVRFWAFAGIMLQVMRRGVWRLHTFTRTASLACGARRHARGVSNTRASPGPSPGAAHHAHRRAAPQAAQGRAGQHREAPGPAAGRLLRRRPVVSLFRCRGCWVVALLPRGLTCPERSAGRARSSRVD
jgi:hypothetical protein